jgi:Transposase, Mutator family
MDPVEVNYFLDNHTVFALEARAGPSNRLHRFDSGMRAPVLAVGDGALGFWKAVRDVFPDTAEQRCWFHKIANVLAALPKSAHPDAKKALAEIYQAENKTLAVAAAKAFAADYGVKWPKAAAKITDDLDVLLAFYDYPAEHWTSQDDKSDRVHFCHRQVAPARHQGPRLPRRWDRDGVQAHRIRPAPVACGQRAPPRRTRSSRSTLRKRQTH